MGTEDEDSILNKIAACHDTINMGNYSSLANEEIKEEPLETNAQQHLVPQRKPALQLNRLEGMVQMPALDINDLDMTAIDN